MIDVVEESFQVQVENPVHFLPANAHIERVQRPMLTASGPKPVRESPKLFLVDLMEDCDHGTLDYFVFQRRDPQRSLLSVGFR